MPDATRRGRVIVFAVVVLLHLLSALLVLSFKKIQIPLRSTTAASLTVLHLTELPRQSNRRSVIQTPIDFLVPNRVEPRAPDEPSPASPSITSSSPSQSAIDFTGEATGAVQPRDEAEAQGHLRNLAGPSALQLEWSRKNAVVPGGQHKLGDTQRFDGGEVITWENDRCYWTTRGVTTLGLAETKRVCKDPPKPVTDLFKDMRKKLEDPDARSTP